MRKALLVMLAAGCFVGSYATDARVISMGKHDAFFMDEVSVFRNPANISIYPNMVYGSFGKFSLTDSTPKLQDPFFGAFISYSLNEETDAGGQYPMLSIGAVVNRYDEVLDYVTKTPGNTKYLDSSSQFLSPVGKIDLMLGYVLRNGVMLGAGTYIAIQSVERNNIISETKVYKGNLGLNWPVAKTMDLEMSISGGTISATDTSNDRETVAQNDAFGSIEVRLFSALAGFNGDFVPKLRVDFLHLDKQSDTRVNAAAGLGVNLNIDKGFFWTGLEFLYGQRDAGVEAEQNVGGRVSFGIERNIIWDWFVIRVGGQKSLLIKTVGTNERELVENPSYDESENDLVGLGFGINIENRLHIDFVASEIFPYTFSNLISNGKMPYLFNRVSATYSF